MGGLGSKKVRRERERGGLSVIGGIQSVIDLLKKKGGIHVYSLKLLF